MSSTDVLYFAICMVGGFFVVAIPWSGIILLTAKREPKPARSK